MMITGTDQYRIIDGSDKMKTEDVIRLLKMTYWADHRSTEQIETSMRNSSCYGLYLDDEEKLVGLQESSVITPRPIICAM